MRLHPRRTQPDRDGNIHLVICVKLLPVTMCATGLFTYMCTEMFLTCTKNNNSTCKNYHQIHKTLPSSQFCSYHSANVSESESASCLHAAMLFVRKKFTSRWSGEGGVDVVKDKCGVWGERKKWRTFAKCFLQKWW